MFRVLVSAALMALFSACVVTSPPPGSPAGNPVAYPGEPPPEAPAPPRVDCAQPPERMCCQAQTAQCNQCRDEAAAERAAWEQQCQPQAQPPAYAEPAEPPPPPATPRPRERVPVTPVTTDPAYPPDSPPSPRPVERVPTRRAPQPPQAAPPAPDRPVERVPTRRAPEPPRATPLPPDRPVERIPTRRGRLGPVAEFSIEPTAGPVGTTVTIYGDFRSVRRPNQVGVIFNGVRRSATAVYAASDRIAVVVPRGARSGPVRVRLNNRIAWQGRFAVTRRDKDIFIPTPVDSGLLGAVYRLPPNTDRLPEFRRMGKPHATIVVPNLRVSPRRFDTGFPGLEDTGEPLLEWFAIRFMGRLTVPSSDSYRFRLNSDDGARLYIDGQLVIDNDGVHAPRDREGSIELGAGEHDVVVEYFQGPRYQIALELRWRQGNKWRLVPPDAFSRYTGDYDCSSQPEMFCCQGNAPECRQCRRTAKRRLAAWRLQCRGAQQPPPSMPAPPANCSQPPQRVCCQGNTARCRQCRDVAANERAVWEQQCGAQPPPSVPAPPALDCSRMPNRACCQGNSARCRQCRRDAQEERREWRRQCRRGGGPVTTPPRAPGPPPINCTYPPQRMCCQAQTAQCQQCRAEAEAERTRWAEQCQVEQVDCSRRPRPQPCCKALTARCRECQQRSQAEIARWEAQCGS